jgi:peptide/nickel transport system permease protein
MRRFGKLFLRPQNLLGILIAGFFVIVAVAAPLLAPPEMGENGRPSLFRVSGRPTDRIPHPPDDDALLGTLPGQLDVYYSLVWGSRHALWFGLTISLGTSFLGVLIGAISGYKKDDTIGRVLIRITDGFIAIPTIIGVGIFRQLMFLAELNITDPSVQKLLLILGTDYVLLGLLFFSWTPYSRIINANVSKLVNIDYVLAAKTGGLRGHQIVIRHLLPNVMAPAIVLVARDIGAMVLLGAAFVFIGIGGESPWGVLITVGRDYVIAPLGNPLQMWWTWLPVTLVLILFGVGWNLLGDGLNDYLNPRQKVSKSVTD